MYPRASYLLLSLLPACIYSGCRNKPKEEPAGQPKEEAFVVKTNRNTRLVNKEIFRVLEKSNPFIPDRQTARNTFTGLSASGSFYKDLDIPEKSAVSMTEEPLLTGDLNHDGLQDAILPFIVKSNGTDTHFEKYYVVFLNNGKDLVWQEYFFRGSNVSDLLTDFDSISINGTVIGKQVPAPRIKDKTIFPKEYIYTDGSLISK